MDYKKQVKEFLRQQGATLAGAAARLGLDRQSVYAWFDRGSLRLSHLERIAAAYGWRVRVVFEPIQEHDDDDNSSEKQTVKNC